MMERPWCRFRREARARERRRLPKVVDSLKVLDPNRPIREADILAPNDGIVAGIDCLRLNRLARMAGAPIDKGAGIRVLKKIGDRVEKGEPIYRIHAFEPSEYELAVGAAKTDAGYQVDGNLPAAGGPHP